MPIVNTAPAHRTNLSYWLLVVALVAIGFLTIFSIGFLLWFIAVALTVMSPFRSKPRIFRPGIALFIGFLIGYVLISPWGCSQTASFDTATGEETVSPVVCTSPVGIEYSGPDPFDPSRTPALVAGGVTAVVAALVLLLITESPKDEPSTDST